MNRVANVAQWGAPQLTTSLSLFSWTDVTLGLLLNINFCGSGSMMTLTQVVVRYNSLIQVKAAVKVMKLSSINADILFVSNILGLLFLSPPSFIVCISLIILIAVKSGWYFFFVLNKKKRKNKKNSTKRTVCMYIPIPKKSKYH